jgi:hypothetical protein
MSQWHQLQAEDVLRLASDAGGGLGDPESAAFSALRPQ